MGTDALIDDAEPEMVGKLVVIQRYKGYKIAAADSGYRVVRATGEVLPIPTTTVRAAYALVDRLVA